MQVNNFCNSIFHNNFGIQLFAIISLAKHYPVIQLSILYVHKGIFIRLQGYLRNRKLMIFYIISFYLILLQLLEILNFVSIALLYTKSIHRTLYISITLYSARNNKK